MQRSMSITITLGMKNPPKKLEFSQFLPRFQALPLLFLRNRYLSKHFITLQYSEILSDNVFQSFHRGYGNKGCGKANQDKIAAHTHLVIEITWNHYNGRFTLTS